MVKQDIIAIILASGRGLRFGKPKAEAELAGKTFLAHITDTITQAGITHIFPALNYSTPDMLATLRQAVDTIIDTQTQLYQAISAFLVFPVDFPMVKPGTVVSLVDAHQQRPGAVIRPSNYGFSGHPIIVPKALDLRGNDHGKGLRGIILHSGLPVIDIQVDDEAILHNINNQEDLSKWTAKN